MKNGILQYDRTPPTSYDSFLSTLKPTSRENRALLEGHPCSAITTGVCLDAELERRIFTSVERVTGTVQIYTGIKIGPWKQKSDVSEQRAKNQATIKLLQKWMADERKTEHDRKAWPAVKKLIEENRLSNRRRFGK